MSVKSGTERVGPGENLANLEKIGGEIEEFIGQH